MSRTLNHRHLVGAALVLLLVLLLPVSVAQTTRSHRPAQAAPAGGSATATISCDIPCDLALDGDDLKSLAAGATTRVRVAAGDHLVDATTEDGKDNLKKEFEVRAGATAVLQLKLRPMRLARLNRELQEQEKSIGQFKSEFAAPSPAPAPTPDVPTPSAPLEISSVVAQDLLISKTAPEYPPVARAMGISGTVVLHGTISPEGSVEELTILSGPEQLQQPALDAVKTWKYKPYLVNSRPFPVNTTFQITFTLVKPPAPTAK